MNPQEDVLSRLSESDRFKEIRKDMASVTIRTWSGGTFHPLMPQPDEIKIHDIAHALSNICRFTGHVDQFYSVAQHSILVSEQVSPEHALCALLHDASEAYLSDIAKPVKPWIAGYSPIEHNLMLCVSLRFDFEWPVPAAVHHADQALQATEARDLMGGAKFEGLPAPYDFKIVPMSPIQARARFMSRYLELTSGRSDVQIDKINYGV